MNRKTTFAFTLLATTLLAGIWESAEAGTTKKPTSTKAALKARSGKQRNGAHQASGTSRAGKSGPAAAPVDDIDRGWQAVANWQPVEALRLFDKASAKNPNAYRLMWGYGAALGQQAKFPESIKWFERAVEKYPSNSRLLSDFGFAYMSWGVYQARTAKQPQEQQAAGRYWAAAETKFGESLKLDPKESMTYSRLAMLSYYRGDYPLAWKNVKQSQKLGGEQLDPQFVNDLAKRMPEPK